MIRTRLYAPASTRKRISWASGVSRAVNAL